MTDETFVQDDEHESQVRRCSKKIITARVMIFIFSGFFFSASFLIAFIGDAIGSDGGFIMPMIIIGGLGLLFLFLGLFSLFWPLIPILIAAVFSGAVFSWWITGFFDSTNIFTIGANIVALLLQVILIWFIIRGAIYAHRRQRLIGSAE